MVALAAALLPRAAGAAPPPLVIYGAIGYDVAMGRAFQKATGIPTRVVHMSTGPLLARVAAENRNPQWDIVWLDGAQGTRGLADQRLLAPFAPRARWNALGVRLQPRDNAYVVTAATVAGVIVVNTRLLAPAARPGTWNDLLSPALRNAVGMDNPAISGPTFPFVAGIMRWQGGVPRGKAWFRKLKANGLRVYNTNAVTLRALQFGQIKVGIVQSSAAVAAKARGEPFDIVYPNPVSLLPRTIGISAHASPQVRKEAEKFIAFVLSRPGQHVAFTGDPSGDSDFNPLLRGEHPNPGVPPLDRVTTQTIRPSVWGAREAPLVSWFTAHIVH